MRNGGIEPIFQKRIGSINFTNNIFAGKGAIITYGVSIGNIVIICAGSIVTKDISVNSVVRGMPAKRICFFDDYIRISYRKMYPDELKPVMGRNVS